MQKFRACRNRDLSIQRFFSTNSACIMAIWPVGTPKETKPSLSQKRKASRKVGFVWCPLSATASCAEALFIAFAKMRRGRRSTQNLDAEFLRQADPPLPSL